MELRISTRFPVASVGFVRFLFDAVRKMYPPKIPVPRASWAFLMWAFSISTTFPDITESTRFVLLAML